MITGLNHITLAVSDLQRSIRFYSELLGCEVAAVHQTGAYLSVGELWLCLSLDPAAATQERSDYTHTAFNISAADFDEFVVTIEESGIPVWKENRSEGRSIYFLDPDGHKLEVHVGTLQSRLAAMRSQAGRTAKGSGCAV